MASSSPATSSLFLSGRVCYPQPKSAMALPLPRHGSLFLRLSPPLLCSFSKSNHLCKNNYYYPLLTQCSGKLDAGSRVSFVDVSDDDDGNYNDDADEQEDLNGDISAAVRRQWEDSEVVEGSGNQYGEVKRIRANRAVDRKMYYLIEWKEEGYRESWVEAGAVATDVVAEYEGPWWKAARAADENQLRELLADESNTRDPDAVDDNGRTALLYVCGIGSESSARMLIDAGSDPNYQDFDGFTPLHIAAGYMKPAVVATLLELDADPEILDAKNRTPLALTQELLERAPKANPLQFARRLALENIVKLLEDAIYENAEVDQILDKRPSSSSNLEYLVRWKDGSGEEWLSANNIADDLLQDFEAGLEYAVAEKVLDRKEVGGNAEYLVQWADSNTPTWEPFENVAAELIAEYENIPVKEVEKRMQSLKEAS